MTGHIFIAPCPHPQSPDEARKEYSERPKYYCKSFFILFETLAVQ